MCLYYIAYDNLEKHFFSFEIQYCVDYKNRYTVQATFNQIYINFLTGLFKVLTVSYLIYQNCCYFLKAQAKVIRYGEKFNLPRAYSQCLRP